MGIRHSVETINLLDVTPFEWDVVRQRDLDDGEIIFFYFKISYDHQEDRSHQLTILVVRLFSSISREINIVIYF